MTEHESAAGLFSPAAKARAAAVHLFTASGVIFAFLAAAECCRPSPDPRWVFAYLAIQVVIDAIDGPLARAFHVKKVVPHIDGRTIDDLVDYLTYTFVPLLLVWRMDWLPGPDLAWIAPAIVASLFGFANAGAKDERGGFFLGFPSYWNIVALYVGLLVPHVGPWPGAIVIAVCTVLTVLPVRFVYPNLAPHPWKWPVLTGAGVWLVQLLAMFPAYPHASALMLWTSLIYPAFYVGLSLWLSGRHSGK